MVAAIDNLGLSPEEGLCRFYLILTVELILSKAIGLKFDPQYNFMATRVGQVEFEGSTLSCTSAVWGKYCGIKIILFIFIYNYIPIVKIYHINW